MPRSASLNAPFEPTNVSIASNVALSPLTVYAVTSACAVPVSLTAQQAANVPSACDELTKFTRTPITSR